ncbi:hypothetical protein E9549_16855 [Blastococcus sp. MG754426]|uniref:hypothetical protein n=1 Tax=unclassified Blastococcus TaxID=2619396 RepID=UPI001EF014FC|nr:MULTISPECIES: hypothetical protein [unclassified Blastococcus]MCF6509061.1 hypothetical protein [Blastococcus sp. MG754426]MCF6513679.1 hypothetical protein [Blastococcus sp. MG754427]
MTTGSEGRTAHAAEVRAAEAGAGEGPEAEVRAAAERWARAAGLPVSVLDEPARPSTVARLLRGLLLGAVAGGVLVLSPAQGLDAALWAVLALLVGLLVGRIARDRRRPVAGAVPPRP